MYVPVDRERGSGAAPERMFWNVDGMVQLSHDDHAVAWMNIVYSSSVRRGVSVLIILTKLYGGGPAGPRHWTLGIRSGALFPGGPDGLEMLTGTLRCGKIDADCMGNRAASVLCLS